MFHMEQNKSVQLSKFEKETLRTLGKTGEMRNQYWTLTCQTKCRESVCSKTPELDSKINLLNWVGRSKPILARRVLKFWFHRHIPRFSTMFSNRSFLISTCYPPHYSSYCFWNHANFIRDLAWKKVTPRDRNELLMSWQEQPDLTLLLREICVKMFSWMRK